MVSGGEYSCGSLSELSGSYVREKSPEELYVSPYELGWGFHINYNHEFVGKDVSSAIRDSAHREMVTLEWNAEDILGIWRSEFEAGEPYAAMEGPEDTRPDGAFEYVIQKVMVGKQCVGWTSGRIMSWYYRKMLSLASIDSEFAAEGTEVKVVWGNPASARRSFAPAWPASPAWTSTATIRLT